MSMPDHDIVAEQVCELERQAARFGWDQPPTLYVLHDSGGGPRATAAVRRWLEGDRVEQLELMSFAIANPSTADTPQAIRAWKQVAEGLRAATPGIYGLAFVTEGWALIGEGAAEKVAERRRGLASTNIADDPRAQEVRIATAYCIDASSYMSMRVRGQTPTSARFAPGRDDSGWRPSGRAHDSLMRTLIGLTGDPFGLHATRAKTRSGQTRGTDDE